MTKVEYIRQLEFSLNGKLSKGEISDILRDYSEYFEAGKAEGKSEAEIVVSLGIPSVVAAEILTENEDGRVKPLRKSPARTDTSATYTSQPNDPLWQRVLHSISHCCGCIWAFLCGLFSSDREADAVSYEPLPRNHNRLPFSVRPTGASSASPPPPPPPRQKRTRQKSAGHSVGSVLLSTLLTVCTVPFILLTLFFGGILLAFTCMGIVCIALSLFFVSVCSLCAAVAVGACVGISFGFLPFSIEILLILAMIFLLAGTVLFFCLAIGMLRIIGRLIRFSLSKAKYMNTARNPIYRAQQVASPSSPAEDAETDPFIADEEARNDA